MIDDTIITRVFENIINNGKLVNVTYDHYLVFKVGEHQVEILILNETKHNDAIANVPLSIHKLIKWDDDPWIWTVHEPIKPGILLMYQIHTSHNDYIVKPKLSKQEEYKEKIDKHLHDYELDYLNNLLTN